jgi:hypothetical protein
MGHETILNYLEGVSPAKQALLLRH